MRLMVSALGAVRFVRDPMAELHVLVLKNTYCIYEDHHLL